MWAKGVIILLSILFFCTTFSKKLSKEGFNQIKKYILKKNNNIFDEFYVDI